MIALLLSHLPVLLGVLGTIITLVTTWFHGKSAGVAQANEKHFEQRLQMTEKMAGVDVAAQKAKEERDAVLANEIKKLAQEQREAAARKVQVESEAKAAVAKAEEQWKQMQKDALLETNGKSESDADKV